MTCKQPTAMPLRFTEELWESEGLLRGLEQIWDWIHDKLKRMQRPQLVAYNAAVKVIKKSYFSASVVSTSSCSVQLSIYLILNSSSVRRYLFQQTEGALSPNRGCTFSTDSGDAVGLQKCPKSIKKKPLREGEIPPMPLTQESTAGLTASAVRDTGWLP